MIEFLQQFINGLSQGAIYALIALGYTMVFGVLRFINFAHGDVFMLGAFAGFYLGPLALKLSSGQPSLWIAGLVLLGAMGLCAVAGMVIERLCYRPLREQPKLTVLITAIGVSLLLENAGQFIFGANPREFPTLLENHALELPESWGAVSGLTITLGAAIIIGVTAVILAALSYIVLRTRLGMAMRALSFNPVAASLMGVNNDLIISFTFGLGSSLAGAAGVLISIEQPSIDPLMGVNAGLKAFVAAVLGGIGNLPGAALGGVLIGLLEAFTVGYGEQWGLATYRDPIVFGVLILILLLRPAGLLGAVQRGKGMNAAAKWILLGVIVLCAAVSPWLEGINPYYHDVLLGIGINVILAAGLNLVNGYTGQFSLGHAGFMAVGAYASSWLTLKWGYALGPSLFATKGIYVAMLLAGGLAAALAGLLVGVPSLRLKGDYLAIVTLGFNEIIKGVIQNSAPLGAQGGLGGMVLQTSFFWTFAFAAVTIYVVLTLVHSTYGRGFLAVRDDEIAAEAMGINPTKYKTLAFVIGAFFAGIAGGLYAHFKQFIHPEGFNYLRSVDIVIMVILGGMGNTAGVCFAAVLLTVLPEALRTFAGSAALDHTIHAVFGSLSPEHFAVVAEKAKEFFQNRMILYSLLLIILMLTRPQGLFGGLGLPRRRVTAPAK